MYICIYNVCVCIYLYAAQSVDFRLLIGLFYCTTLNCLLREAIDISTYIERACTSALFYNNYTNDLRQILVRSCSGRSRMTIKRMSSVKLETFDRGHVNLSGD